MVSGKKSKRRQKRQINIKNTNPSGRIRLNTDNNHEGSYPAANVVVMALKEAKGP